MDMGMCEKKVCKADKWRNNLRYVVGVGVAAVCAALALVLRGAMQASPQWVEERYARGAYAAFSQVLSRVTGILPFSLAEALILLALLGVPALIVITAVRAARRRTGFWRYIARCALSVVTVVCAFVTLFYACWGYNYYRLSYAQIAAYDARPAGITELRAVCEALAHKAVSLRELMPEDEDGVSALSQGLHMDGRTQYLERVQPAYDNAGDAAPWLAGRYGVPKPVALSIAMSQAQVTGIYIPFTFEANVNTMGPAFMLPATACHEAAHQRGFAREDEANFIAYYVCAASSDTDFQYSGVMLALLHAGNALADADYEAYQALRALYSEGMRRDLRAYNAYWEQFKGPLKEVQTRINDAYLKSNGQEDGVKSYGRMVDLLIAEFRAAGSQPK